MDCMTAAHLKEKQTRLEHVRKCHLDIHNIENLPDDLLTCW